jgi:hypothetical protein
MKPFSWGMPMRLAGADSFRGVQQAGSCYYISCFAVEARAALQLAAADCEDEASA